MRLENLPSDMIERLATEPGVHSGTVRTFLSDLEGLTVDTALATLDLLQISKGMGMETYMALAEGISDAVERARQAN